MLPIATRSNDEVGAAIRQIAGLSHSLRKPADQEASATSEAHVKAASLTPRARRSGQPNTGVRKNSAELAAAGFLNERGSPTTHNPS